MARNIGGSLLPSSSPQVTAPKPGKHGTFETRALPALDTHGLFLNDWLIAMHPNGYSCDELAKRLLAAWEGTGTASRALEQFDYVLACGGMGKARAAIERIAQGEV